LTGLSTLALALSGYLGWHYLMGGSVVGCGGGSPCDEILESRWSAVGGWMPVSGLAAGVYLAILLASFFIGPATEPSVQRLAWRAMLVLAGAVAGSAVWFTLVQKWVIGAFCPYCMATHLTGLLLAALIVWRAPLQADGDSMEIARIRSQAATPAPSVFPTGSGPGNSLLPAIGLMLVGLALAGVLAACQVVFVPAVYRGGESRSRQPALDLHAVPLVGSPDAAYVVTVLFDYNCPHCQQLHCLLDAGVRRYGGKLAFALCPTPLNPHCNPYVPRNVDAFKDSCDLAKVALAVWVAKPEAFRAFDQWMFSFDSGDRWRPRSLDDARAKAVELIGQAKFDAVWANPWIAGYLQTAIRIYGDTIQNGNGAVPRLVFKSRWVIPQPKDPDDLVLILQDRLAVPKP
jgi:uncharacterized membrane protein/protein-disulfide isomerase